MEMTAQFTAGNDATADFFAGAAPPTPPGVPKVPQKPEYYGSGLPGEDANTLQRFLTEDYIVRQQNNPLF